MKISPYIAFVLFATTAWVGAQQLSPPPVTSAAPSGAAGGDLSGTYPNPTVAKVAGTTPTTPVVTWLGAPTAANFAAISKITLTPPATGATLTILDGKTLIANNTITIAGTDGKGLTISNTGILGGGDAWTLAIAAGKTLTVSNNLTFTGTDGSSVAVGAGGTLSALAYSASGAGITAGTVANAALTNSSITIAGSSTALGGTYAPARTQSLPANKTITYTVAAKMMGLAGTITPVTSGNIKLEISANANSGTASQTCFFQIYTGTGAAPANGDAVSGTGRGNGLSGAYIGIGGISPYSMTLVAYVTGLTPSTAYWIDVSAIGSTNPIDCYFNQGTVVATEM